jgi:hypothetical protein
MPPRSNNLTLHSIHVGTFKKSNNIMQITQIGDKTNSLARSCSLASCQLHSCNRPGRCASVSSGFALPRFTPVASLAAARASRFGVFC